MSVAI